MLVDRGGFWYRVLAARYGEEVGRMGAGVVLLGGGRWQELGTVFVRLGGTGSRRGCRVRWGMEQILSFGMIGG